MNKQHIDIERSRVVRIAAMTSAYTAAKRKDADELCDTVPMVEADDEMLVALWMKSCAQLLTFLRKHLRRNDGFMLLARYDVDGFHAILEMPLQQVRTRRVVSKESIGNLDELGQLLDTSMTAYLANDILAGWMSMALPEREPACRAQAEQVLTTMEQMFSTFRHPLRVRKRMEVV